MDQGALLLFLVAFLLLSIIIGFGVVYVINLWQGDRQKRFGDHDARKLDRIEFGESITVEPSNYYEVMPRSDHSSRNTNNEPAELCPLCRQPVLSDDLYTCSSCQTSFHKTHYDEFFERHGYCPYCRGTRQR